MPNVNKWVKEKAEKKPKSCLIKLYDEQVRAFKLNDNVTFIGVLEFNTATTNTDEEMKSEEQTPQELSQGIPNENRLPHLHAITFRRNQTVHVNSVLRHSQLQDYTI